MERRQPRFRSARQRGTATAAIVVTLLATALSAFSTPTTAQEPPAEIILGATKNGIRNLEDQLDRTFDAVRTFEQWDSVFPDSEERLLLSQGRTLLVSIYPQRNNGSLLTWAQIAAATPGSALHDDIVRWADRLKPYQDQLYVTFNHEPETTKNQALGTAAEFQDAWHNVMTILDARGLRTKGRLFIVTSSGFGYPSTDRRAVEHWYPGDDWVDAVGGDAYNFFQCRPTEPATWLDLSEIIEGQRLWGVDHPDKALMLPEFATVGDPAMPGRRAVWIDRARATLKEPMYAQFTLAALFYNVDAANGGCDYFNSTSDARQAFYDFANDPAFGGSAGVGVPSPTACHWSNEGGTDLLHWNPAYEAAAYQIFLGGPGEQLLVGSTSELFFAGDHADGSPGYRVAAVNRAGQVSDLRPCVEPPPEPPALEPPASCEWARDAGAITVSWLAADQATAYVVYRTVNGSPAYWRGRVEDTEFVDSDVLGDLDYSVRSRAINGSLSISSTTCVDTSPPPEPFGPPPSCTWTRANGTITVNWTPGPSATNYIIYRTVNGAGPYWQGRTVNLTFSQPDRTGELTYTVASKNQTGNISNPQTCLVSAP